MRRAHNEINWSGFAFRRLSWQPHFFRGEHAALAWQCIGPVAHQGHERDREAAKQAFVTTGAERQFLSPLEV